MSEFSQAGYQALVNDIFRRFPSVQKDGFSAGAYKPGLERMEAFDKALGSPSKAFRSIHVAGTNGKGSVCNMLASALGCAGLKTGLFTSPHILDFRERMRISEGTAGSPENVASRPCTGKYSPETQPPLQLVPQEFVFDFLTEWLPWISEHELSFFEITTGMAFAWFAQEKVDVAVIETGLGGRLDSTNILTPVLSIVTTIGLDHCALLGDTLQQIAAEKAGIFKRGVPALVGEFQEETAPVFNDKAWMFCPLSYASEHRPSLWGRHAAVLKEMDLQAPVQEKNLRTVLCALDILRQQPAFQHALSHTQELLDGIIHTARNMDFHGRWERLSEHPYVIADIGHNPQALQENFKELRVQLIQEHFSSLIVVYGVMADKDFEEILPLMPRENTTYIFATPDTPRALPAGEIMRRFLDYGRKLELDIPERAFCAGSVRQAVQMAVQLAQNLSEPLNRSASGEKNAPPLIYIGGSTFVVAEALPLFKA